ncbi:hypothetical protein B0T25DRAFT_611763 [Lasiosphaeria hispida]|uniref:UBZ4-type domain-containing protein n=1 Tax=Lasiosphaeria hispida TaxID=260671 RepID=A0AAJ0HA52_9PEZI|nr:hypothetical protein B0T25DRAFT_611763 [Lasiosphaeria hispida]
MPRVPTTTAVLPGARVNIVLKQDQPTGRTEAGVVQDVLTRGNHPRGIKVRLTDGRVGRVQSMAVSGAAVGSGEGVQGSWEEGPAAVGVGLDAYLKPAKQRGKRRGRGEVGGAGASEPGENGEREVTEISTCPVCGEFEGDEAAVAHHVAGHFDD